MSLARYIVVASAAYYMWRVAQSRGTNIVQKFQNASRSITRDVVNIMPVNVPPPTGFNVNALLNVIARAEANRGYDSYYVGMPIRPRKPVSQMSLAEVFAFQDENLRARAASTAVGRYQFIKNTLRGLVNGARTPQSAIFNGALQDQYAIILLQQKGLDAFRAGRLSAEQFASRIAQVWAGLPRDETGVSYYAGVGDNRANVSWGDVLNALRG